MNASYDENFDITVIECSTLKEVVVKINIKVLLNGI